MPAHTNKRRTFCSLSLAAAITYTKGRNTMGTTIDNVAVGNEKCRASHTSR
jgi:hypothetical protein